MAAEVLGSVLNGCAMRAMNGITSAYGIFIWRWALTYPEEPKRVPSYPRCRSLHQPSPTQ